MSESKTGVSRAARELAEKIYVTPLVGTDNNIAQANRNQRRAAEIIQSALSELLDKAGTLRRVYAACYEEEHGNLPKSITDFDAVAEPWRKP